MPTSLFEMMSYDEKQGIGNKYTIATKSRGFDDDNRVSKGVMESLKWFAPIKGERPHLFYVLY